MTPTGAPAVTALDHLILTVTDVDAALTFQAQVLGMTALTFRAAEPPATLTFEPKKINLHPAVAHPSRRPPTPCRGPWIYAF